MAIMKLKIQSGESVTGVIELEKLDGQDDVIERKVSKGVCLSDILRSSSNGQLSMGELEINLDFDEHGQLVQVEFYT